jgi:hypothetical protein
MQQRKKSSPARTAAARSNGAKSAGPKTAAGKRKSSRNSLKHGINCTTRTPLLLPGEDSAVLQQYAQAFYDHFRPSNLAEGSLVDTLVALVWKSARIHGYEAETLTSTAEDLHPTLADAYESIGINRLFSIAFESPGKGQSPLALRYLTSNRNMFRSALSDFLRLRQAKADPGQPCIPVPQYAPVIQSFCIDPAVLPVSDLNTPIIEPATGFTVRAEPDLPATPEAPLAESEPEPGPEPQPEPVAAPAAAPAPVPESAFDEPPMLPNLDETGAIHLNMAGDPIMMPNSRYIPKPNAPCKPVHYTVYHFPNERFNTKLVPDDPRFTPDGRLRNEPKDEPNPCLPSRSTP